MTQPFENLTFRVLAGVAACVTLLLTGCEPTYEPLPYKAAPRVGAGDSDSSPEKTGGGKNPDITNWTSPDAVRNAGGARGVRGYRGMGAYRGMGRKGYAGVGGYRGYGNGKAYRGYGQSNAYRGYGKQRGYRGN